MSEQAAVAESTPAVEAVMDVSRGPLVDITPEQRAEFRKTGELPTKELPKKEEAAPSSESKPVEGEAKPAGESETPESKQEIPKRGKTQTAEERILQLEATIEKIRKGKGIETPKAESTPAPKLVQQQPPTRPKPTSEDKKEDGTPKFQTYEDFVEDLADWKSEQREVSNKRLQAETEQAKALNAKVEEAKARYENFADVVKPAVDAIVGDPDISPVVKRMLDDSEIFADLVYTLASDSAEFAKFVTMSKENPGKAIRYIALTESLIAEELASKAAKPIEETPVKPKTNAPKPPSEAGGRAAAPPDSEAAAIASSGGKLTASVKAEFQRRALAKLKS